MIVRLVCIACDETLSLLTVHAGADDTWGRALVCREELENLTDDLKGHRRDTCTHYKQVRAEYLLKRMRET